MAEYEPRILPTGPECFCGWEEGSIQGPVGHSAVHKGQANSLGIQAVGPCWELDRLQSGLQCLLWWVIRFLSCYYLFVHFKLLQIVTFSINILQTSCLECTKIFVTRYRSERSTIQQWFRVWCRDGTVWKHQEPGLPFIYGQLLYLCQVVARPPPYRCAGMWNCADQTPGLTWWTEDKLGRNS